ncbi:ATP-dependent Clp protease proteolytic subunit [Streptomyces sp. G3]|uniref:head maturation protease, ClpP-related n=1 Tax=Streptomyces sp. G3 TaxID=690144 RepID=UPI00202E5F18|nr:head maturation protease, ClpP-related [Streptomyces sp. G3]MCM1943143.1 ATP-dependent Clp protease proteolytic subunit [Streptomyces sp. G3]
MPFIDLPDKIPGLRAQARSDRPWYQFRNVAADEAELFLYDEIGGWGTLAEDFISELKAITSPKLRVRVSSPGGSVFEGVALANALRAHPAEVTVQVDGIAASIASVIAMAADRVVVQPQAMVMIHDASGVCLGNAQDMQDMAALLDKISDNIADAYSVKAGGTRDEWRTRMRAESWFTAEEAVEAGLADEMMPARKAQPDEAEPEMRTFDLAAYGYHGPRAEQPEGVELERESHTLHEDIRSLIGEEIAAQLAAVVAPSVEDTAPVVETTPVEPATEPPATVPEAPAAEPEDEWAASVASLLPNDGADDWSAHVSHLTDHTASSSAATEAA